MLLSIFNFVLLTLFSFIFSNSFLLTATFKYAFPLFSFGDVEMAELKIKIPDELEREMEVLPENWSDIALGAIKLKVFESQVLLLPVRL